MANLYELPTEVTEAMDKYFACFDSETWELVVDEETLAKATEELQKLENKRDESIEWVLKTRQNSVARQNMIGEEISRLSEQANKEGKTIEKMESLLKRFFPEIEKPTVVGNWTLSYRKSEKCVIDDKESVPEKWRVTETVTVEKIPLDPMKKAIKAGEVIPGVRIEENKNLQVK